MNDPKNTTLKDFAIANELRGLSETTLLAISEGAKGYSVEKAKRFLQFQHRINDELLKHKVITNNEYTAWFQQGEQSEVQLREFIVQFSVFSNLFLIAQLHKMINADTLEGMRASKEILANEIGVVFKAAYSTPSNLQSSKDVDAELVSTEGSVEGGTFRFQAAHFEWLLLLANQLGLEFDQLGKRMHGSQSTLFFCDELTRLYGNADYLTSQAASYAVENWAAAGFWDELVEGFEIYNDKHQCKLRISFFSWHAKLEAQHAQHTQEELEELYFDRDIDEDQFIQVGNEMLDGVWAFWQGLNQQRKELS